MSSDKYKIPITIPTNMLENVLFIPESSLIHFSQSLALAVIGIFSVRKSFTFSRILYK